MSPSVRTFRLIYGARVRVLGEFVCLALVCLVFHFARAQEPVNTLSASSGISSSNSPVDMAAVAVPEPSAKALSHYRSGMVLVVVTALWNLFLPALFLFTGFSARLRAWAGRVGRRGYLPFLLYCLAFIGLYYAASLPLTFYAEFIRPHSYDLSNQTLGKWFGDSLIELGLALASIIAVGWVPFKVIQKSPQRWWIYLGLLAIPYMCFLTLIGPVVIDPLFNKFQPLQDKVREAEILALAARAGIEGGSVYEVDKSADTKTVNAYVTGLLGTKRIVLWDTALKALDKDELLFVMGHEMGHYVLHHVPKTIAFGSVLIFLAFYVAHRVSGRIIARFKNRWGFDTFSDFAALPYAILLTQILAIVLVPLLMAYSRHLEHEADRFGLELTRNNHAAAMGFVKLQQNNLSNPRPGIIHKIWLGSHPALGDRIDFCNRYRPWATGQGIYDAIIKKN